MTEIMNSEENKSVSFEVNPSNNSRSNLFNHNVQNFIKHYGTESEIKIVNNVLKLIMRWLGNTENDLSNISNYAFAYFKLTQSIDINDYNCYKTLEINN